MTHTTSGKRSTLDAYHYAAQAVVGMMLGLRVQYVTIRPDRKTVGGVVFARPPRWVRTAEADLWGEDPRQFDYAFRQTVTTLAGSIAAHRARGRSQRASARFDRDTDWTWVKQYTRSEDEFWACRDWIYERARAEVNRLWPRIRSVAEELQNSECVSGEDVTVWLTASKSPGAPESECRDS